MLNVTARITLAVLAVLYSAVEAPAFVPTTFAGLPEGTRVGIVSAMRADQPIAAAMALLLHDRTAQLTDGDTGAIGEDSTGTGVNGGVEAQNTVPGAPTGVSGTAGNAQVSVAFTAPTSTGGAAITGYTVTASPGGATATGASSPLVVTGLTNGTAYTFTATATNSVGASVASAVSAAVTVGDQLYGVVIPTPPSKFGQIDATSGAFTYIADMPGGLGWPLGDQASQPDPVRGVFFTAQGGQVMSVRKSDGATTFFTPSNFSFIVGYDNKKNELIYYSNVGSVNNLYAHSIALSTSRLISSGWANTTTSWQAGGAYSVSSVAREAYLYSSSNNSIFVLDLDTGVLKRTLSPIITLIQLILDEQNEKFFGISNSTGTLKLIEVNAINGATRVFDSSLGTASANYVQAISSKTGNYYFQGGASSSVITVVSTTTGAVVNSFPAPLRLFALSSVTVGGASDYTYSNSVTDQDTKMIKVGTGSVTLTGTNTYREGTDILAGSLIVANTSGSGTGTGRVTVGNGATLSGTGRIDGHLVLNSGATISPGESPGTLSTGSTTFTGGTKFTFEINNATGTVGTNWDLLRITGALTISSTNASPFIINLTSLTSGNSAGLLTNFNSSTIYSWKFASATTGITGFTAAAFQFNVGQFQNSLGGGHFVVSQVGDNLYLNFMPGSTTPVVPGRPSAPTWVGVRRHHLALLVDFAAPEVGFADTTLVFHVAVQDSARQPVATTTVTHSGSGVIIPYIKNEEAYWVTVSASNAAGEGPQAPWVLAAVPAWAFYPKDQDGRPCPSAVPCSCPWRPAADAGATPTAVTVARVVAATVGSQSLASSSQLAVRWCAAAAHHFEVVAREAGPSPPVRVVVAAPPTTTIPTTVTLTGLKAKTVYTVTVAACATAACEVAASATGVPGETETEYWQLSGTGNTVDRLATVVSDGHARLSATRFGPDAGAMAHRVQLYYAPLPTSQPSSLAVGVASAAANAATPDSYLTFTSRAGASGLITPPPGAPLVATVAAGQGVPVARDQGAFVRLFFEAEGADGRTRILWVDSQDGYDGLDFHTGSATTCRTAADYTPGGGCAPRVAIAVEGDATGAGPMRHARQPKVAWPTLDAPHWDLSAGSFMVFTVDRVPGCAEDAANVGYAVWDGTTWVVSSRDHGCPTLLTSAQAAFPVHRGGARYRLYYGDSAVTDGRAPASTLPFVGPKRLLYADGVVSGLPGVVDIDDWEPQGAARDIHFLWPTGDLLDARAEGYINDYHVLLPTGDPALQVMYLTITDGALVPIAASALLRNP